MNMDDFKRDYKYKSEEGQNGGSGLKWLLLGCGAIIAILTYLFS